MNRGDTSFLMLDYTINGDSLEEGAYEEIELTINRGTTPTFRLLLDSDIDYNTYEPSVYGWTEVE